MKKSVEWSVVFLLAGISAAVLIIAYGTLLDKKKCSDFATQKDAQSYMIKHNATWLDRNSDGVACQALK